MTTPFSLPTLIVICIALMSTNLLAQDSFPLPLASQPFRIESDDAGWKVYQGESLISGYVINSQNRPVVFPIIGPGGHALTRSYPIEPAKPLESVDHDHHRSLWFSHGDVNGVDFWTDDEDSGKIVQTMGSAKVDDQGKAIVLTENDWIAPDGRRIVCDVRRVAFSCERDRRVIDFDIRLIARDAGVVFGDTKEGTLGIRVAGSIKVDANQGGSITNASGDQNAAAWGKRSPWVDYSGRVPAKHGRFAQAGITVHDHPSNFGFPVRWHVRTYGLLAANPFGISDFDGGKKRPGFVLKENTSLRLSYRIVLHPGKPNPEIAEQDFRQFAQQPRTLLDSNPMDSNPMAD